MTLKRIVIREPGDMSTITAPWHKHHLEKIKKYCKNNGYTVCSFCGKKSLEYLIEGIVCMNEICPRYYPTTRHIQFDSVWYTTVIANNIRGNLVLTRID